MKVEQKIIKTLFQCQIETHSPLGHTKLFQAGHWELRDTARDYA